jgi:hypothetical protein
VTRDTLRVLLAVLAVLAVGTTVYRYAPSSPLCWPAATGKDCYP